MYPVPQETAARRLWWVAAGIGIVLTLATATALWHLRRTAVDDQARELRLMSLAFSDGLERGLRGAEEGLRALRLELRQHRLQFAGPEAAQALRTRAALMPLAQTLWVVAADGSVVVASDAATPLPVPSSFLPALDQLGADGAALSRPFTSDNAPQSLVALAVRITDTPAELAGGWIVAAMPAEALRGAFSVSSPAPDARLAVFRDDGARLVGTIGSAPVDEARRAYRLANFPNTELRRFNDGVVRLVRLRNLPRYGVKLMVTRDLDAVLAPWREVARLTTIGLLLLLASMGVSVHLVLRADRRSAEARRALEIELARASKLKSLGTLAGGVAHDFNNVLAGITGFCEMAQDAAPRGSEQARHLEKLLQAASRGKALVARILALGRGGARTAMVFELEPVVDEVLALLSASLPPGVTIERRIEARDARVRGDPTRVFEAMMNLCTNAMQAMPAGGVMGVELRSERVAAQRVLSHSQLAPGNYVALTVSDQGSGITAEVMERLFEPFFTTRSAESGTGLGLAVVHGVVAEFGGAIDVRSTPGRGARFILYFPQCAEAPSLQSVPPPSTPAGAGQSLLVVDDEPALMDMMSGMLKGLGYEPVGYSSPSAALQALRDDPRRFAAVVTDEAMPGLTGTQLTEALRAHLPRLPVLLVSGHGGALLASRAAAAGVSRVLTKPLRRAELATALAELLDESASEPRRASTLLQ